MDPIKALAVAFARLAEGMNRGRCPDFWELFAEGWK